jgi:hypothetical protein
MQSERTMSEPEKPLAVGAHPRLPKPLDKPRLCRKLASEYLALVHGIIVAPATLAKYASVGGGPRFYKWHRTPLYPTAELEVWAEQQLGKLRRSTSDKGTAK